MVMVTLFVAAALYVSSGSLIAEQLRWPDVCLVMFDGVAVAVVLLLSVCEHCEHPQKCFLLWLCLFQEGIQRMSSSHGSRNIW
mmetsp:Transcript_8345/g.15898  ORF Transcript_8345/g.15898 Transcript_8345/m.15898 type:complete len:83 (+) Transcript_8345:673-921(+)